MEINQIAGCENAGAAGAISAHSARSPESPKAAENGFGLIETIKCVAPRVTIISTCSHIKAISSSPMA